MKAIYFLQVLLIICWYSSTAQNWETYAGGNYKNGLSKHSGPISVTAPYWTVNSSVSATFGNAIYTFGDKFATARVTFSPSYIGKIELRNLTNGSLIWEKMINSSSKMFVVGFTEDAVYACDYNTFILYALDVQTGNTKWSYAMPTNDMFPGNTGICFADDGDPIIFGARLDRKTGIPKWTNNYLIPIRPDGGFVVNTNNNTYYHWKGTIMTPKTLIAIDINTGLIKYETAELPGDADQENDLVLGPDGTIYMTRDGNAGSLKAYTDNGTGFVEKWSLSPGVIVKSFGPNNVLYCANINHGASNGPLMRVNGLTGAVIDYVTPSTDAVYVSVGCDSTVYVATAEAANGRYIAYTPNLQTIKWTLNVPYNIYGGCPLGKEGVFVATGEGTTITAYKRNIVRKPVADFRSSGRDIDLGTNRYINYFDQSSYNPTAWQWFFEGGTPNTSTQQNPTNISYSTAGIYQVKLIASNAYGSDTIIRTKYVFATGTVGLNETAFNNCSLGQNYPNPFSASTTINFGLTEPGYVTIKVMDLFGKEVRRLSDNQYFEAGNNEVVFAAEELTPGIYLYTLALNNHIVATKKMTIIK